MLTFIFALIGLVMIILIGRHLFVVEDRVKKVESDIADLQTKLMKTVLK